MLIHGGGGFAQAWKGAGFSESGVARLAREACDLAGSAGLGAHILADGPFFTAGALSALRSVEGVGIVARARMAAHACRAPPPGNTGKRRKKGEEAKPGSLFRARKGKLVRAEIEVCGRINACYY
jgi:hypothetical protein